MKNLPISAGSSDVRSFFSGLKIPDGAVHILGGDEGEVFVGFASDEDARLAMARQGQMIHGSEIRLLLSSKTEQTQVIEQHKSGLYSSPLPADDYVPTAPPAQPQAWTGNPYAARSGYEASYPPQNSNARPEYANRRESYGEHNRAMQTEAPAQKREESPRDDYNEYGYKATFDEPPANNRFGGPGLVGVPPPMRAQDPIPKSAPIGQTAPPLAQSRHQGPPQQISPKGNYGFRGNNGPPPAGNQGGDSWRDSNYGQPPSHFNPQRNGPPAEVRKPPVNNPPFPDSHRIRENVPPPQQQQPGGPPFNGHAFNGPPSGAGPRPFQNGPHHGPAAQQAPPPHHPHNNPRGPLPNQFPNRNGLAPFQNGPPHQMNRPNQNHPPAFRGPPSVPILPPKPAIVPKVTPPISQALAGEKYYIEMTRLPNDLLSNSALDKFIQPSVPLSISSLKTVYGPGGIHIHTIIRLDSIQDYAKMIKRDGEMGIKIRKSDKATFETADDAPPIPIVSPKVQEEEEAPKRRSRWGGKSPQRKSEEKERSPPRRRSRSPAFRKRRRSRSPRRREEHTDPTRWSVQVTNVPFRMREEDLIEWFSEKARPAKLARTFYSDGNASDRWVAEFSSESLMKRAFSIRTLCHGRTLKLSYIDNEKADEIMKIEDMYGNEKRLKNEEARIMQEQVEAANPPSFFNQPAPRGPPHANQNQNPNYSNQSMPPPQSSQNGYNNGPPMQNGPGPGHGGPPPMRGGFAARGGGPGFPQRGGMSGGPSPPNRGPPGAGNSFYPGGPSAFGPSGPQGPPGDMYRGSFRGGRGRGGGPPPRGGGGYPGGYRDDLPPARNEFMEVVQSIGPRGTVLGCTGFPSDVTLSDVCDFFHGYDPDRNSIRIRRTEDGIVTGECLLAVYDSNIARRAVEDLDGQHFRNSLVQVQIL